jgi:hypothetical protein
MRPGLAFLGGCPVQRYQRPFLTTNVYPHRGQKAVRPGTDDLAVGTAEISLVISGIAAAGSTVAIALTYKQGRERFDHERRLADLDAVRRVLDESVASMSQVHRSMAALNRPVEMAPPNPVFSAADVEPVETAIEEMFVLHSRLEIRFGAEHELVAIHNGASSAALSILYRTDAINKAPIARVAMEEHSPNINRAVVEFGLARQSFTSVAYRVVGVRLPAAQLVEVTA